MSSSSWNSLYEWLSENHHQLSKSEKDHWVEHLSEKNEKILELWSERLELLDEIKDRLLSATPITFKKEEENLVGIQYFHLGLYEKAADALLKELLQSNYPSRVYLYLGFAYLYMNEQEKTKEHLLNVVHRSHDVTEKHFAFLGLGLYSGRMNDIEQAIIYLEKAENLLFNSDVVYNLGICYLLLEMPSQAIPYFEKVIDSGAGDGEAFYWLGKCYLESDNHTQGMETWYRAVQEFDSKELLHSLAMEFEKKELFSCAVYCYERLKDIGDDSLHVIHGLAWNYGLMDERQKSLQFFQTLFRNELKEINPWISYIWLLNKWDEQTLLGKAIDEMKSLQISHPLLSKILEDIEK